MLGYIIEVGLPMARREQSHEIYKKLIGLIRPERSYFARYDDVVRVHIALTGSTTDPKDKVGCRMVTKLAKKALGRRWSIVVTPRGELTELHSILMAVALHPESANRAVLVDALHWTLNAAGYGYLEEAMLYSWGINSAVLSANPNAARIKAEIQANQVAKL